MSRPIPLREVRQSAKRSILPVSIMAWILSDGTAGLTGDDVAPDRATARRVWPHYRRAAWSHMFVGRVPCAAAVHDGLTTTGRDVLWNTWQHDSFSLSDVLEALAADRAALKAFEQNDPKGAATVEDYLLRLASEFDRIESEARRFAAASDRWRMSAPELGRGGRYEREMR